MSRPVDNPDVGLVSGYLRVHDVVIQARGLRRRFGSLVAVDGLDLDVFRGEVFGFLGPNGAGKSTCIRMLVGLMAPSEGSARVLGYEMPKDVELLRPHVGYMTQKFSLYGDLTVEENLDFTAEIFGLDGRARKRRVEESMEEFGLGERRRQMPATLSGGWKQRLALAAATIHRPQLLFLDEPTAGVDPDSRRMFWAKLFEIAHDGTTILVSTHYMDEAIRCHRLCVIRDGKRAALGSPSRLTATLDGRVAELKTGEADIERALVHLNSLPGVASVTQLGNRLHLLLAAERPSTLDELVASLAALSIPVRDAKAGKPNLEDVFVALAQGERLLGVRS